MVMAAVPINIAPGVTLTNGIALFTYLDAAAGFQITGGGTLFQNSVAPDTVNMHGPITVIQSQFRVTDVSSNSGLGSLGDETLTLDGGTLSYGGTTAATVKTFDLTLNGGTIQVESAATTLTLNGAIAGLGGLTKTGPGTLVLTWNGTPLNSFNGLTINGGTVLAANDNVLGVGPITVNPAGTLSFTASTTTARTISLNSGTMTVASSARP